MPRLRFALLCALPVAAGCAPSPGAGVVPDEGTAVVAVLQPVVVRVEPEPAKVQVEVPLRPADPRAEAETQPDPPIEIPAVSDKFIARILDQQARVNKYARVHGVDPDLVNAVIWVESKFNRKARGPAGAMGLMQLMPRTAGSLAKRLKRRSRPYDPDFNIDAGCLYLHRILSRFDGDERLSLAAYNRGVGKVKSWLEAGEDLPERTAAYVDRVLRVKDWIPLLIAREQGQGPSGPEEPDVNGSDPRVAVSRLLGLDLDGARGILTR